MTDLDWLPPQDKSIVADKPAAAGFVGTPRKCRRHLWAGEFTGDSEKSWPPTLGKDLTVRCLRCNVIRDETRARRGKSSRRLGHDGERRSEKRYGWRKVGEYGGITDLEGTLAIVQQKTSRRAPPVAWKSIFAALEGRAGGRIPLILLSFVRAGGLGGSSTEDFIVIRGRDWLQLHGRDEPGPTDPEPIVNETESGYARRWELVNRARR